MLIRAPHLLLIHSAVFGVCTSTTYAQNIIADGQKITLDSQVNGIVTAKNGGEVVTSQGGASISGNVNVYSGSKVTLGGGSSANAVSARQDSTFSANTVRITAKGSAERGLDLQVGAQATLENSTVQTIGRGSYGVFVATGAQVTLDNTTIDSQKVGLQIQNGGTAHMTGGGITTHENYANGIYALDVADAGPNAPLSVTGTTIATEGESSNGVELTNLSTTKPGGLAARLDSVNVMTKGTGSKGLSVLNGGPVDVMNSSFHTTGQGAVGAIVQGSAVATLSATSIKTEGGSSYGIWAPLGGRISVDGGSVVTTGAGAHGAVLFANAASLSFTNHAMINTFGEGAFGVLSQGKSSLNLGGETKITAMGAGAPAVFVGLVDQRNADGTGALQDGNLHLTMDDSALSSEQHAAFYVKGSTLNAIIKNSTIQGAELINVVGYQNASISGDTVRSGHVNLAADGSTLIGAVVTDAASQSESNLILSNGSRWMVTGDSAMTTLSNHASTIAFAGAAVQSGRLRAGVPVYKVLTVMGDYHANNGKIIVNTEWNDSSDDKNGISKSDVVDIQGTATGSTTVSTENGIIGNITAKDEPIYSTDVIRVADAGHAGTFTGTAETTNAGQAQLVKKGATTYVWTLNAAVSPIPSPSPDADDWVQILTPGASGYVQMSRLDREIGFDQLSSLHQRVGEQRSVAQIAGSGQSPVWGRVNVRNLKEQGSDRLGYSTDLSLIQFGWDLSTVTDSKQNSRHLGVMASYSHGDHDFYDKYRSENGLVTNEKQTGRGKTDLFSLGAYGTWYRANGIYVDVVGNVSTLRNKYDSSSGRASQHGYGLGTSVEVGRSWPLGASNWTVEPQMQLAYQYVHLNAFEDNVRDISGQSAGTLRARAGVRLAYNTSDMKRGASTFHWTANVLRDLAGGAGEARIGNERLSEDYARTSGELLAGLQLPLGKTTYLHADMRYTHALGGYSNQVYRGSGAARESLGGQIGLSYSW